MKQAYLITAYKNFDELYELAEILSKTAYVFIHVDEKSREITDADVEKLNRLPGCEAIREYRIVWGWLCTCAGDRKADGNGTFQRRCFLHASSDWRGFSTPDTGTVG